MSASSQDMMNQLQMALATGPQQSLFGVTAPPDQSKLAGLLQQLKQQQFAQQQDAPTPGPYGYLHDAGKAAFTAAGQQMGTGVGGALQMIGQQGDAANAAAQAPPVSPESVGVQGVPGAQGPPSPTAPTTPPPAPLTNPQAINAVLQRAKAINAAQISNGVPADAAKVNTLKFMVSQGVPGAEDQLVTAQQEVLKNASTQSQTSKDTAQGNAATDEISHRALDDASKQFTNRPDLSNPEYLAQQDGNGKITFTKRSDKASLPQTPEESSNADAIAQKIGNYDLQMSDAVGRGNVQQRQDMLGRVLKSNPDFDVKNFKQSQDALKAYGPSGTQGQMVLKTQNAMNHLEALDQWGRALKNGDSQTANAIGNSIASQFNNPALSSYNTAAPIVANEVSSAIVKGGGGVQERLARVNDFSNTKDDAARGSAINAARSLLGAQYKNNQNLYEQTTLRKDFDKRFPVQGSFPPPPGTGQQPQAPPSSGWGQVQVH
jgi:hypothetical protein